MMKNERLDEITEQQVAYLSNDLLKCLDEIIPESKKYSHINICINVLIVTLFQISETFFRTDQEKIEFADQIANTLKLNYEINKKK